MIDPTNPNSHPHHTAPTLQQQPYPEPPGMVPAQHGGHVPQPQVQPYPIGQAQPAAPASPTIVINNSSSAVATTGGYAGPQKSTTTAYLLWFFLGALGAHKFYLGKPGMGVLYIFTAGLFVVGIIYDLFTLGRQVRTFNTRGF